MSEYKINIKSIPEILLTYCQENQMTYPRTSLLEGHITTNLSIIAGLLGNMCKIGLRNGYKVHPNLYSYLVGASGLGKSVYLRPAVSFIGDLEGEKTTKHKAERISRETARKKLKEENSLREKQGLPKISSETKVDYPEGLFNCEYTISTSDFTIEGLQEMAAVNTGGNIFVIRDELGGTFKLFRRVGRENDIPFLIEGYEGISSIYTVTRKMKEAKIPPIYNMCVNIFGGIQLAGLRKHLSNYESEDERHGFYARFQNVCIVPDKDEEQQSRAVDKNLTRAFEELMTELVEERVKYSKAPAHQMQPEVFKLSEEAEYYYMRFFHNLKDSEFFGNNYDNISYHEHLQKTGTFALKVALIFHILNKPQGKTLQEYNREIDFTTLKAAIDYAKSRLEDARELFNVKSEIDAQTEELSNKLWKGLIKSNFYKKNKVNFWTANVLCDTQLKVLPRKQDKKIDRELLQQLLGYLATTKKLALDEQTIPKTFQTQRKYSFYIEEKKEPDNREHAYDNTASREAAADEAANSLDSLLAEEHCTRDISQDQWRDHARLVKSKVDLKKLVRDLAKVELKSGVGKCPFHDDKSPSFSVGQDKYNCFVCPDIKGGIYNFVMQYLKCDFYTALQYLEQYTGTTPLVDSITTRGYNEPIHSVPSDKEETLQKEKELRDRKSEVARELYLKAKPTCSSSFEYFKNRIGKSSYDSISGLLEPIRILESHYHSEEFPEVPIMIWPIKTELGLGNIIGAHRTYLTKDLGYKATITPNKKIKGNYTGGVILLKQNMTRNNVKLIIAEGIETTLSAAILKYKQLGDNYDCLCSCNASNLVNLDNLLIKKTYSEVIIAADNDEVGLKYSKEFEKALIRIGVTVSLITPQDKYKDFNDELKGN